MAFFAGSSSSASDGGQQVGPAVITQDGIGRVCRQVGEDRTHEYITGLYTEGLETCVVVFIVGSEVVSLIHASSALDYDCIASEFEKAGELEKWGLVYNATRTDHEHEFTAIRYGIEAISKLVSKITPLKPTMVKANDGYITISARGECEVVQKPEKLHRPKIASQLSGKFGDIAKDGDLRTAVALINVFFTANKLDKVSAILQFDGKQFYEQVRLQKSQEQIEKMIGTPGFIQSRGGRQSAFLWTARYFEVSDFIIKSDQQHTSMMSGSDDTDASLSSSALPLTPTG